MTFEGIETCFTASFMDKPAPGPDILSQTGFESGPITNVIFCAAEKGGDPVQIATVSGNAPGKYVPWPADRPLKPVCLWSREKDASETAA